MSLTLHIPSLEELSYREKLLSQPETMAYNRGYDLPFEGYDRTTGCIAFPREKWAEWYSQWIGAEPERFLPIFGAKRTACSWAMSIFIADRVRKSRTWAW